MFASPSSRGERPAGTARRVVAGCSDNQGANAPRSPGRLAVSSRVLFYLTRTAGEGRLQGVSRVFPLERNGSFDGSPKFAFGVGATYLHPVRENFLTLFADGQLLYTLSHGTTSINTTGVTGGLASFADDYENRYAWDEYQAGFGVQVEIPWAKLYTGAIIRSVDGSVSRRTISANGDIRDLRNEFSKEPSSYAMFGADIPI